MDKPYIVDFVSIVETGKNLLKIQRPIDESDLKVQLESLLIERSKQGYRLVQIIESKRHKASGENLSGLIVVFEKKEKK